MGSGLAALMGVLSGAPGLEAGIQAGDEQRLKDEQLAETKRHRQLAESQLTTPVGTLYKTLGLPVPTGVDESATVPTHLAPTAMSNIVKRQTQAQEAQQLQDLTDAAMRASTKTETFNAPLPGAMGGEGGSRPYDEQTAQQTKTTVTNPALAALAPIFKPLGLTGAREVLTKAVPQIVNQGSTPPPGFSAAEYSVDATGQTHTKYKPSLELSGMTKAEAEATAAGMRQNMPTYPVTILQDTNGKWRITQHPPAAAMQGSPLNDSALDDAAVYYNQTGTLPQGMGRNPQTSRLILNRAAELRGGAAPRGVSGNAAETQASYGADTKALAALEKQHAQIAAFEATAQKNADIALRISDEVARTGSPILNQYLLSGRKNLAGDPKVAQFDAATKTFVNEYAKITSSATGGGVTSDEARRHASELLNTAMTPEQFRDTVAVLKQEMDSRIQSFREQRERILGNIRSRGPQPKQPQSPGRTGGGAGPVDPLGIR